MTACARGHRRRHLHSLARARCPHPPRHTDRHVTPTGRTLGQSWRLLAQATVVLGVVSFLCGLVVASPLGPAAFAPFALFPVWVIVVAAVVARRMHAIDSQN